MSWCRFGSPCDFTIPQGLFKVDAECAKSGCPGSDLYIFESDLGFECCGCRLRRDRGFIAKTEVEMRAHIEDHVKAGHHVRQSLRPIEGARELTDRFKGTIWDHEAMPLHGETAPASSEDQAASGGGSRSGGSGKP